MDKKEPWFVEWDVEDMKFVVEATADEAAVIEERLLNGWADGVVVRRVAEVTNSFLVFSDLLDDMGVPR